MTSYSERNQVQQDLASANALQNSDHRSSSGKNRAEPAVTPSGACPPEYMRPKAAAAYSGISVSKLAKLRMEQSRKDGPPFVKAAGCVVYRRSDLDAWLASHLVEVE